MVKTSLLSLLAIGVVVGAFIVVTYLPGRTHVPLFNAAPEIATQTQTLASESV